MRSQGLVWRAEKARRIVTEYGVGGISGIEIHFFLSFSVWDTFWISGC